MLRLPALLLVLVLAGCPGLTFGGKDSPIIVDSLCATSSAALTVLTVQKANGALSAEQIVLIDSAVDVIDPICNAPSRPSSADAIERVEHGLLILQGVKGVQ